MKPLRLLLLGAFCCVAVARATTMIFPVEAIADLWNFGEAEFKQRYGGINVTGIGPSDEGWYVRYRHENLTMLFGPLPDREEARKKKWELEAVRDAAIRNRATLSTSQVDYVRFTFSGVYGKRGDGGGAGGADQLARVSADGRSGPDGDIDGDGIPNAKDDDMDGDGIPNDKDDDIDGDGIPNGKDDYAFGTNPGIDGKGGGIAKDGTGQDGENGNGAGKEGQGANGDKLAGNQNGQDGNGNQNGSQSGMRGSSAGQSGDSSQSGSEAGSTGQQGGQKGRQVASNQRGSRGSQSGSSSSSGQSGSQSQSSGGGSSSSSSSSQSGGQSAPVSGGGGSGNPLSLLGALIKLVLGI